MNCVCGAREDHFICPPEHRLVRLLVERNDLLRVIGNPVRVTDVTLPNTAN